MNLAAFSLAVALAMTPQQGASTPAQDPAPVPTNGSTLSPDDLPVSLERIQRALAKPPAIKLDGGRPVFRVEIFGKKPTIEDILGPEFYKGAVQYGGMTHNEFLSMVTPKDVQGYAAFSNREGATVAATSLLLQWALQKALHKFSEAKQAREREAARREVLDALAELDRARARAGLPPR
jgi:hypothetical protein